MFMMITPVINPKEMEALVGSNRRQEYWSMIVAKNKGLNLSIYVERLISMKK